MRLFGFRREDTAEAARVSATVAWEEVDRPAREIHIEVAPALASALTGELDGFAIAAAVVAQHHGERRLLVDGTLCPRLAEGLATATRLLASWFPAAPAPVIESARGFAPRVPPPAPRAAVFLSAGLDSLFAVAQNRDRYPPDHPAFFRDAIVVEGYIFERPLATPLALDYWRRTRNATSRFAAAAGLEPLFVRTNFRSLEPDIGFFAAKFHSSLLAAISHGLSRRVSSASIAADLDFPNLRPWGSHPMLDPLFSGSALPVFHVGAETSRVAKAARISAWPEALASLMICTDGPLADGFLNCGRCEKCVRTLAAIGPEAAAAVSAAQREVTPAIVRRLRPGLHPWAAAGFWTDLAKTFRSRGQEELTAAADDLVLRARRAESWGFDRGWKGALRRIDRRLFGSALLKTSRYLRGWRSA